MEAQTASSAATQCQKRLPYDNSAVVDNENAPTNYLNRESISVQGSGGTITSVVKKQKANNKNKDKDDSSEVTENVRKMTLQLIAKTATLSRKKNENNLKYLARLTHLRLEDKKIAEIENLHLCPRLCTMYLRNNLIQHIAGLNKCTKITHIYLENNRLTSTAGLENLPLLQKLVLDNNFITEVSGLEQNIKLRELYVSYQKLPDNTPLTFTESTLQSIGRSLEIFKAAHCHIEDTTTLAYLNKLQIMDLSNNNISKQDFGGLATMLGNCVYLTELNLSANPICKEKKYRDNMILQSTSKLNLLDNKSISQNQRTFLMQFADRKRKLASKSSPHENLQQQQGQHHHQQHKEQQDQQNMAASGIQAFAISIKGATVPHGKNGSSNVLPVHSSQLPSGLR